jgi:hypothetical protein
MQLYSRNCHNEYSWAEQNRIHYRLYSLQEIIVFFNEFLMNKNKYLKSQNGFWNFCKGCMIVQLAWCVGEW